MNIEKLKNIADYKSRVSLISLFGDDKISEDIETDIPDKLKKLHEHMKSSCASCHTIFCNMIKIYYA